MYFAANVILKLKMRLLEIWVLLCIFLVGSTVGSTVFIADHGMSKMIELSTKPPYCVVQMDRGKIRYMLLNSDPRRVRQVSDESITNLERVCNSESIRSAYQGGFIYPGTKWCGPGTIAQNISDLGVHVKEDMCCREHDNCPNFLEAGECRQGICNNSPFTRSHCDCDAIFRKCLQNVNSETANTIGAIFFNIIQVICFKERTPCSQWQSSRSEDSNTSIDNQLMSDLQSNEKNTTSGLNTDLCEFHFVKSGKFVPSIVTKFNFKQRKAFILNKIFNKLGLL